MDVRFLPETFTVAGVTRCKMQSIHGEEKSNVFYNKEAGSQQVIFCLCLI